jgi:hypothetical protein
MRKGIHTKTSTQHFEDSGMMVMDGSIGNLRKHAGLNGWSSLMERRCGSEILHCCAADGNTVSIVLLDVRISSGLCSILKGSVAMSNRIDDVIHDLAYWQLKLMLVNEEIDKHPERQNVLITPKQTPNDWRNEIKSKISDLTEELAILLGVRQ